MSDEHDDPIPTIAPDVLAGMLASTLDEAMSRLHRSHVDGWTHWRSCGVSTLCQEATRLVEAPETQLAIVAARHARGEHWCEP